MKVSGLIGGLIGVAVSGAALAQTPAPASPLPVTDYAVVHLEATIARPAQVVWAKAGGFCDIYLLQRRACAIVSGDGEVPTIRSLGAAAVEHMIAKTSLSYTYGQIVGSMKAYDYHVTLAAAPVSPTSAKLTYTFVYDQASMSPELRAATRTRLQGFQNNLDQAKAAIEGGP